MMNQVKISFTNKTLRVAIVFLAVLFFSCSPNVIPFDKREVVNVKYFGAKGNGVTDDTHAIQTVIYRAAGKKKVIIPVGNYMIDGTKSIMIPSNSYIEWEKGATFKCIPNSKTAYRIINVLGKVNEQVSNILLLNPTIIGDRNLHKGTKGEHGHGMVIGIAKNIKIENPTISDCWGDGLAIYGAENVEINNLFSDNNRRQGLTITSGKNIIIRNPICSNMNGTAPESGIDIEPNYKTDHLERIRVINPITKNNKGAGITLGCKQFLNATKEVTIIVENHIDSFSAQGYQVASLGTGTYGKITGYFKNINGKYINNQQNGIIIRAYSAVNTPKVIIENPFIENPNSSRQPSPRWGSGIAIAREIASPYSDPIGNITITNPTIIDSRKIPVMRRGIYAIDDKNSKLKKLIIRNPKLIEGTSLGQKIDVNMDMEDGEILDNNKVTSRNITANTVLIFGAYSEISNEGAQKMIEVSLNIRRENNSCITFTNRIPEGMKIIPLDNHLFYPISKKMGKYIQTKEKGASITLFRKDKNIWGVKEIKGNWTVEK